jgi:hypothetical protein
MKLANGYLELGCGIYEIPILENLDRENLDGHFVFLDRLILPCAISELSLDQIGIVNRYREQHYQDHGFFSRARTSQQMFRHFVLMENAKNVLEIGCGKFPIVPEDEKTAYSAIEIDSEAIEHCRKLGLHVESPKEFLDNFDDLAVKRYDMIFGSFVLHFRMEVSLIEGLSRSLASNAVMYFNFILQDGFDLLSKLKIFTEQGMQFRIYKTSNFSRREFLLELSNSSNNRTAARRKLVDKHLTNELGENCN